MKKRKKPDVGTWYAVKFTDAECGDKYLGVHGLGPFARACLSTTRRDAGLDAQQWLNGGGRRYFIVPVRGRALTSKKRNAKRTR